MKAIDYLLMLSTGKNQQIFSMLFSEYFEITNMCRNQLFVKCLRGSNISILDWMMLNNKLSEHLKKFINNQVEILNNVILTED